MKVFTHPITCLSGQGSATVTQNPPFLVLEPLENPVLWGVVLLLPDHTREVAVNVDPIS